MYFVCSPAAVLSPSHSFSDDVFSSTGNNSPSLLISKQLFSSSLVAPATSCKPSSTDADQNLLVSGSDHLGASLSSVETEGGGAKERWTTNHHVLQSGSSDGGSLNAECLSISLPGVHAILECLDSEDEPGHDDVYKGHMMRRNSSPLHRFKFPLNHDSTDAGLQSKSISTVIQNSSSSSSNLHYDSQRAPIRKRHYSYSGQQSQGCSNTHHSDPSAPPTSLTRSDGKLNQKMKRSISEGLEGIMKKVVGEKKRIDFTASAKVPTSGAGASKPVSLGGGGVAVRNLVCSPVAAVEKRYPEFVFTPGRDHESKEKKDSNGNGNELLDGSEAILEDTSCNLDLNGSQLTNSEDQQNSSQNLNADSVSAPQQDEKEEHVCMKHVEAGLPPYNHWRTTSRTFSNVTFEARLTVAPRFHCTASVYPSFLKGSCQFNTEMNILESISTLLNNNSRSTEPPETDSTTANGDNKGHDMEESPGLIPKIMAPSQSDSAASNGGEENCYIIEESPSLISKSRRTKLINRAANAVVHKNKTKAIEMRHTPLDGKQVKPAITQSTENDDKQLQTESNTAHQTTWTASPLISMKRRTQLIKLAASRFKKRRKGAAEHQSAKNDEPLIHTQTPLEDRSVTESSATSDIALPTTHEHASSCVLYTTTITIPAAAAAAHSRLHFSQQGEMPSDLDRLISSLPSSPRKRDKGVSFQRVSSADERRNKINYTYEETRPLTIRQNSEPHLYARLTQSPTSPRFNVIQPASLNNGHNSRSDFAHKIRPKSSHSVGSHHHHDDNTTTFSNQLQEDKAYKSLEALPSSQQREVLYTFPSNKRPITVVVKGAIIAKSFPSLDESSSHDHDPDLSPLNATLKPASSQPVITTQYVQVRADKRYKCWSTQL